VTRTPPRELGAFRARAPYERSADGDGRAGPLRSSVDGAFVSPALSVSGFPPDRPSVREPPLRSSRARSPEQPGKRTFCTAVGKMRARETVRADRNEEVQFTTRLRYTTSRRGEPTDTDSGAYDSNAHALRVPIPLPSLPLPSSRSRYSRSPTRGSGRSPVSSSPSPRVAAHPHTHTHTHELASRNASAKRDPRSDLRSYDANRARRTRNEGRRAREERATDRRNDESPLSGRCEAFE